MSASSVVDKRPSTAAAARPHYGRVLWTFFRNSLVREMTFRGNFLIETVTNAFWFAAQLVFYLLIFGETRLVAGWSREQFFAFMATGMIVNTLIEAFFMPNCANFSELVRTGNLDFALLKPIDTQFLISFEKVDLGALCHLVLPLALLSYALVKLGRVPTAVEAVMYTGLVMAGVVFFYSLMIVLASTTVWFGRNQGLYEFWFYITIFARYPRDFYAGRWWLADLLRVTFSYVLPILLVVTVPAEVVVGKALEPSWVTAVTFAAAILGLYLSRRVFNRALRGYRSASS
ncbi:MAG: ABC transporter permease [Planctomycetaceae bacterium]